MPYPAILPVTIEPGVEGDEPRVILHPDMPTDLEELQKSWEETPSKHTVKTIRGKCWTSPDNSKKNSRSTHSWVQRESVHGRPEGSFIFFIYFYFVSPNEANKKKKRKEKKKEINCLANVCFSFVLTNLNSKILENIAYAFHSF